MNIQKQQAQNLTYGIALTSEASIEKLAISILKDTEGGLCDAATINIVEMIDSITNKNGSYTPQ